MNRFQRLFLALALLAASCSGNDQDRQAESNRAAAVPAGWQTTLDPATGRFGFVAPDGSPTVLHGISMTGLETGTRETAAGGGFWLFQSGLGRETTDAPPVLQNVADTLVNNWNANVVRIPICGSAWMQQYVVHDWGTPPTTVAGYRDWLDVVVQRARARGAVVIIDNHLWAIAKMGNGTSVDRGSFVSNGQSHKYSEFEDGSTGLNTSSGKDSSAPVDWYTGDVMQWECPIANADGVSIHNAYYNRDKISEMWRSIATRYKDDSGVWFELYNEPYARAAPRPFPASGENMDDKDQPWDLWTAFMMTQIKAIRDDAKASNMIIVNGMDWGYDFGPEVGPIAHPDQYLPWVSQYENIAYGFHPYQHGSCCGQVGVDSDQSASDPFESAFCSYYSDGSTWGAPSGDGLPDGKSCSNHGYAPTQDKKMPPCIWVAAAFNPATKSLGLCAGERGLCNPKGQSECEQADWSSPSAGGWSRNVLPMAKFGPLIATEFGSFDCSSPYVKTLLKYMHQFGISYSAWALWSQNSGGPDGLGSCGYPSVMKATDKPGDFHECEDAAWCPYIMQPLPWSGQATFADLGGHVPSTPPTGTCDAEGGAALRWEGIHLHDGVGSGCWSDLCGSFVYQATEAAGRVPVAAWATANTADEMMHQAISAGALTSWGGSCPCGAVLFYASNNNNSHFGHVVLCNGDGTVSTSGWPGWPFTGPNGSCGYDGSAHVSIEWLSSAEGESPAGYVRY